MKVAAVGAANLNPPSTGSAATPPSDLGGGPFGKVIDSLLRQTSAQGAQADKAVHDLATGQTDELHNVMLAVAKADLTFRLVLEVRNRLTEAYQEVMRMQV